MKVPNFFPTTPSQLRIALVGEAPGVDEERIGQPFVGMSGRFLAALLNKAGTSREACFLGNISQERPPNNEIFRFSWDGPEIQSGMEQLNKDLAIFKPNLVVLLGNVPLKAAKDPVSSRGWPRKFFFSNRNWRGSLFIPTEGPLTGYKCMATYHPAACLRDYNLVPYLNFDLKRAVAQGRTSDLVLPKREYIIHTNLNQALTAILDIRSKRLLTSIDIEGGWNLWRSIGLSNDPLVAHVIPWIHVDGRPWWNDEEDLRLVLEVAGLLEDPMVPKCGQNLHYDRFSLHWGFGIRIRGVASDIMLKHWELNSELAQDDDRKRGKRGLNLGVQASIYTLEPYWKGEIDAEDDLTFFRYNGKDSAVTLEISQALDRYITFPSSIEHSQFNHQLTHPILYLSLKGIRYDSEKAKQRQKELQQQMFAAQFKLNLLTNKGFQWKSIDEVTTRARELFYTKNGQRPYKKYEKTTEQVTALLSQPDPSPATAGEIEDLCEVSLNVGSTPQMCGYLYETLHLPPQYEEDKAGNKALTTNYEALLKLSKHCVQNELPRERVIVETCIELRALDTRQRALSAESDFDGRIRASYNLVGSNTGRVTCSESPTGSGGNLQTVPNYTDPKTAPGGILGDRDLYLADQDYWFFQCDLKGADGWTVAAYCAMLGDSTMLDDYLFGIKPYQTVACKLRGYQFNYNDRPTLKDWCKKIEKDSWDGFACKRVQHGKSYVEGDITVSRNILKDSEGKLFLSPSECSQLGAFFLERYPGIPRWHQWVGRQVSTRPILKAASGQVRQFNGRPDEILTKAVAFEPQANTTYATNLALLKLWTDPDNWVANGTGRKLHIQPLHQVHDALCGQFPKPLTAWAVGKIKSYFNNPLNIAGTTLVIPFDGGYGPSWGSLNEGVI